MPDHMGEDEVAQRPQPPAGLADPVAQGGAVKLNALPGQDLALPVERDAAAVVGRHSRCADLHSRPSRSRESCAGDSVTDPVDVMG